MTVNHLKKYQTKYLGIHIDQHLKWDIHNIQNIITKLRKLIYVFLKLRPIFTLRQIYYALSQLIVTYANIIWGGAHKTTINKLEVMQRLLLKVILKKQRRYPTEDIYRDYKVLDVRQLYIKSLLIHYHSHVKKQRQIRHSRTTRLKLLGHMTIPRTKLEFGHRHYSYLAPKIYNKLPHSIRVTPAGKTYNKQITKWLLTTNRQLIHNFLYS